MDREFFYDYRDGRPTSSDFAEGGFWPLDLALDYIVRDPAKTLGSSVTDSQMMPERSKYNVKDL